eukprot:m51a1_g594 hypothetical protein (123) ;mRNA; f:53703-56640
MRTIVLTTNTQRRYFVLASCTRQSDPTEEEAMNSLRHARIYDEARIKQLIAEQKLLVHDLDEEYKVVFLAVGGHTLIGGLEGGFHKMIKSRYRGQKAEVIMEIRHETGHMVMLRFKMYELDA